MSAKKDPGTFSCKRGVEAYTRPPKALFSGEFFTVRPLFQHETSQIMTHRLTVCRAPLRYLEVRFTLFTFFILISASSWASDPCTRALQRLPWIEAEISNVPIKTLWETRGFLAVFKGKRIIARPCMWCPHFENQHEVESWLSKHPLGPKTERLIRRLQLFSTKNVTEHFHGITLRQGQLYFLSNEPIGPSLTELIESTAPWIFNFQSHKSVVEAPFKIEPAHTVEYNRIRGIIRTDNVENSIIGPIRFDLEKTHLDPMLLNFLGTIEWSFNSSGKMRMSFLHLDHVYDQNGKIKEGLIDDLELVRPAINYDILLSTLLILKNENLPEAMIQMLNKKNLSLLVLPDFLHSLSHEEGLQNALFYKLKSIAQSWNLDHKTGFFEIWMGESPIDFQSLSFATPELHDEHFAKHGHEFQAQTKDEYLKMALEFVQGKSPQIDTGSGFPLGIRMVFKRKQQELTEYVIADPNSNAVAVVREDGLIKTYFIQSKKTSGLHMDQYITEQLQREYEQLKSLHHSKKKLPTEIP